MDAVLQARGDSPEAKRRGRFVAPPITRPSLPLSGGTCRTKSRRGIPRRSFFTRLLAAAGIDSVNPDRGRFRSFLLGAVKHFLANMHDHAHRLKRGAGEPLEPIEAGTDTSPGLQLADPNAPSPDRSSIANGR